MVEKIPVVFKAIKFGRIRLIENLVRLSDALRAPIEERPQECAGRKIGGVSYAAESF
jgi:hypothetical protein